MENYYNNNHSRHKHINSLVTIFFFIFPFFKPIFFDNYMRAIDVIMNLWQLFSFVTICLLLIHKKRKISLPVIIIIIMQVYLVLNTILQGGAVYQALRNAFSMTAIVLIIDAFVDKEKELLSSLLLCFEIMIYINFITIIFHPKLIYSNQIGLTEIFYSNRNYFLGYYNNHDIYYIPALVIAFLYKYCTGKKVRCNLITCIIVLSSIMMKAGGTAAAITSMVLAYLIFGKFYNIFNYATYWLIEAIFYIVVIRMHLFDLLRRLVEQVYSRGASLLLRNNIWDHIYALVRRSLLFGYGVRSNSETMRRANYGLAIHAHNLVLQVLYIGGIIYLCLFILLIYISGRNIYKNRKSEIARIISIGFLGWSIHCTVEPFISGILFSMFIIAYYYGNKEAISKKMA